MRESPKCSDFDGLWTDLFVEEEDHRCFDKNRFITNLIKQFQLICHRVLLLILKHLFIITAHRRHENHRGHAVKAVDPFLTFRFLSTFRRRIQRTHSDDKHRNMTDILLYVQCECHWYILALSLIPWLIAPTYLSTNVKDVKYILFDGKLLIDNSRGTVPNV